MRKIICSHVCPPIPVRDFDWEAIFDGDEGEECAPRGWGRTEAEARQDLIDNYDDEPGAFGSYRPRRCATNRCGAMGECLACDADQGEACRNPEEKS